MKPQVDKMLSILARDDHHEKHEESRAAATFSLRLLVRAANQDRGLLEDRDWQQAMEHLNAIVKKEQAAASGTTAMSEMAK